MTRYVACGSCSSLTVFDGFLEATLSEIEPATEQSSTPAPSVDLDRTREVSQGSIAVVHLDIEVATRNQGGCIRGVSVKGCSVI